MIKYVFENELEGNIYVDPMGNRLWKETDEYVIVLGKEKPRPVHTPIALIMKDGEWVSKQLEFDFG